MDLVKNAWERFRAVRWRRWRKDARVSTFPFANLRSCRLMRRSISLHTAKTMTFNSGDRFGMRNKDKRDTRLAERPALDWFPTGSLSSYMVKWRLRGWVAASFGATTSL